MLLALASRQGIDLYGRLAARYAFAFVSVALKHRRQIVADPISVPARLKETGRFLLASNDLVVACHLLSRAWSIEVRDRGALKRNAYS